MGLRKYNPIGRHRGPVHIDTYPTMFLRSVVEIKRKQLSKFEAQLQHFCNRYGFNNQGHTLCDAETYWKLVNTTLAKEPRGPYAKPDGALLTKPDSDLDHIMRSDGDWSNPSPGMRRVANIYWNEYDFEETREELDRRMQVVTRLFRWQIEELADRFDFRFYDKPAPWLLDPKVSQYKGGPYRVWPVRFDMEDYYELTN